MDVGSYYLGQEVARAEGLREFSAEEYVLAETVGMKRMIEGEKFFAGTRIQYGGIVWDSSMVASVKGSIYKIALRSIDTDGSLAKTRLKIVLDFMVRSFGKYKENNPFSPMYVWGGLEEHATLYAMNNLSIYSIHMIMVGREILRTEVDASR